MVKDLGEELVRGFEAEAFPKCLIISSINFFDFMVLEFVETGRPRQEMLKPLDGR